jgi:DNA-directed RNA polymerase subunit beta
MAERTTTIRNLPRRPFGTAANQHPLPNLVMLQTESYARFLQADTLQKNRSLHGLNELFHEIFPIYSYDQTQSLEFLGYELSEPRYTVEECKALKLTFGAPLKATMRLNTGEGEPITEDVYLGEVPLMIGGGEFIVNGAERVVVSQIHRSPGSDFSVEVGPNNKVLHRCSIVPERGSWIELSVTKRDTLQIKIDQSGKFCAMTFFRAMYHTGQKVDGKTGAGEDNNTRQIVEEFYETEKVKPTSAKIAEKLINRVAVTDIVNPETGELFVEALHQISPEQASSIHKAGIKEVVVIKGDMEKLDALVLNSLRDEDGTHNQKEALENIYKRLRPGNPVTEEKARTLFIDKFYDETRYRFGRVGRFRLNRKFGAGMKETEQALHPEDIKNAIRYIIKLRRNDPEASVDDIDHLGNRRIKMIDELVTDEMRKGFLKLKKNVQERMNLEEKPTPRSLINAKTISSAVAYFFGRSELSQVVDQTNPLSQLAHERRVSALGPGGLNRKRAGFEVRDVHISHYGRICPIETPEGANIGLISYLSTYAIADSYGFLVAPYKVAKNGKVTDEVLLLRADEEGHKVIAPADTHTDAKGNIKGDHIAVRVGSDFKLVSANEIELVDVSPMQMVGVSAALIPFLEHDDANRALMGSNMQRQAVPLVVTEPPLVSTGMEVPVATNSSMVVVAKKDGTVHRADSNVIEIGDEIYPLRKYGKLNERTCQNQYPVVKPGEKVKKGQVIADGASTCNGELSLGKNVLVAFMPWDGYNYEDAILVSEKLAREDTFTSIHIEEFEVEIHETKLGKEEFTPEIPHVSERMRRNLDEGGVIRVGAKVKPGDILVGKVAPKSKSELSPEEKLLHAIFGKAGEDVKNDSLEVPAGVEGIVIGTKRFSRRMVTTAEEKKNLRSEQKRINDAYLAECREALGRMVAEVSEAMGSEWKPKSPKLKVLGELGALTDEKVKTLLDNLNAETIRGKDAKKKSDADQRVDDAVSRARKRIFGLDQRRTRETTTLTRGDELPTGVLEKVTVYLATKRNISVGDKFAGRHGNKGVVSRVMPIEDMPFLEDGTPVDMVLNPLGVPSRMNVGQLFELHLGAAAAALGFRAVTPVFGGANEAEIDEVMREAGLDPNGKRRLIDGRTGESFDQEVAVGYMYMFKLHHLVDEKVHARATGPYSLITQQPLGGKARSGGQRFGEMEVWALEAYGASYILQELLTVKSDDVDGRTKIYESMVKGTNILEPGMPVSFDVLTSEIRGLGLNMTLVRKDGQVIKAATIRGDEDGTVGAAPATRAIL